MNAIQSKSRSCFLSKSEANERNNKRRLDGWRRMLFYRGFIMRERRSEPTRMNYKRETAVYNHSNERRGAMARDNHGER